MIEIKSWSLDAHKADKAGVDYAAIDAAIAPIKQRVTLEGDDAVIAYTRQFDAPNMTESFQLQVQNHEFDAAYANVSTDFLSAIQRSIKHVTEFHSEQVPKSWNKTASEGYRYGMQFQPLETVGLYVPGGRALYPSSVVMNAVPAVIAGVEQIVMVTPPRKDGSIAPEILVAAKECKVDIVIKAGGSQAIFALAAGTQSIPQVDKIVGPGNAYVDRAKQQVYGQVDIDKPAGPSEVLVYIEDKRYAGFAAAEVLAQCEHDPLASGVVVASSQEVLEAIQEELARQYSVLKRRDILDQSLVQSSLYKVNSEDEALMAMNAIATEHLCLLVDDAQRLLPKIKHAGAIFCGPYTPVALGDYIAGPNHVLPTAQAARFSSALSVMDFMKFSSVLECSKEQMAGLATDVQVLTKVEGLDAHGATIQERLN